MGTAVDAEPDGQPSAGADGAVLKDVSLSVAGDGVITAYDGTGNITYMPAPGFDGVAIDLFPRMRLQHDNQKALPTALVDTRHVEIVGQIASPFGVKKIQTRLDVPMLTQHLQVIG